MKKICIVLCLICMYTGCKTVTLVPSADADKIGASEQKREDEQESLRLLGEEIVTQINSKTRIVYVEKPIYRPQEELFSEKNTQKADEAVLANIIKPETYSGSAMIYDYNQDFVYEVYTKALRVTDIYLEAGEKLVGDPMLSDTVRFVWDAGKHYEATGLERQHIYIKPIEAGLEATLTLNTDLRSYHILLKSYKNVYMPIVKWRYPLSVTEKLEYKEYRITGRETSTNLGEDTFAASLPDFNFKVTYVRKPYWLPKLVYAFEGKTYIILPKQTFERELPGFFGEKKELINYRIQGRTVIIDKLLDKITLKYNGKKAVIRRIK